MYVMYIHIQYACYIWLVVFHPAIIYYDTIVICSPYIIIIIPTSASCDPVKHLVSGNPSTTDADLHKYDNIIIISYISYCIIMLYHK